MDDMLLNSNENVFCLYREISKNRQYEATVRTRNGIFYRDIFFFFFGEFSIDHPSYGVHK